MLKKAWSREPRTKEIAEVEVATGRLRARGGSAKECGLVICSLHATLPFMISFLFSPPTTWHCSSLASWPAPMLHTPHSYINTTYLGRDNSQITWHTPWFNFGAFLTHPTTIQPRPQHPLLYTFSVDSFKLSHAAKQIRYFCSRGICIRTRP
jgi:hypothetical protein